MTADEIAALRMAQKEEIDRGDPQAPRDYERWILDTLEDAATRTMRTEGYVIRHHAGAQAMTQLTHETSRWRSSGPIAEYGGTPRHPQCAASPQSGS